MNPKLLTTLTVTDLAPAASIAVAHGLSTGGAPLVPDVIVVPSGVDATADDTEVTFTNNGSADVSFVSLVTRWHSIARELGGAVPNLTPQPYVIKSADAASGGVEVDGLGLVIFNAEQQLAIPALMLRVGRWNGGVQPVSIGGQANGALPTGYVSVGFVGDAQLRITLAGLPDGHTYMYSVSYDDFDPLSQIPEVVATISSTEIDLFMTDAQTGEPANNYGFCFTLWTVPAITTDLPSDGPFPP